MTNDSKRGYFGPLPLGPGESLLFQVAFRDGKAYAAPIGSPLDFHEAWIQINSLESLAVRLGVSFDAVRA